MQDKQTFIQLLLYICRILNSRKVRYMVVGGAAVNAHGYYRPTTDREGNPMEKPDIDIWFQPTYLNYMRMLNAFDDLGFDTSRFREEAHPFPKSSFFHFKPEGYTLDFLPRLKEGFVFSESYGRRLLATVEDIEVSVISLDDLINAKKATGRKKDLEDVRILETLQKT